MHASDDILGYSFYFAGCVAIGFLAIVATCIVGWAAYLLARDLFRFGSQRVSAPLVVGFSLLVSGVSYPLAGAGGLAVTPFLLIPYSLGRLCATKRP